MVTPIAPSDAKQYQHLQDMSPEQLYREGSRYKLAPGELSSEDQLKGYIATNLVQRLTVGALALLGKSGVVQVSTQIFQENFSGQFIPDHQDTFMQEEAKRVLSRYNEADIKQIASNILLFSDEGSGINYINDAVRLTGFDRYSYEFDREKPVRIQENDLDLNHEAQRAIKTTPRIEG